MNADTIAALERAANMMERPFQSAPIHEAAALIRAHIETLRAGQCRALGALPGKEPVMHLPAKKEP